MNKGLICFIALVIVTSGVVFYFANNKPINQNSQNKTEITNTIPSPTKSDSVPHPSEEDIIRNFFNLINEKKTDDAVNMMSEKNTSNSSTKNAWKTQFDAFKSINVQSIEKSMEENWSENSHTYKVTLEVFVSSEATNAPIPNYGYEDNPNIRWIPLIKENNNWKIDGLATGP